MNLEDKNNRLYALRWLSEYKQWLKSETRDFEGITEDLHENNKAREITKMLLPEIDLKLWIDLFSIKKLITLLDNKREQPQILTDFIKNWEPFKNIQTLEFIVSEDREAEDRYFSQKMNKMQWETLNIFKTQILSPSNTEIINQYIQLIKAIINKTRDTKKNKIPCNSLGAA